MTIAESLYFMYNGISSQSMGIINCSVDKSGMQSESFFAESEIMETTTRYNNRPFFQGIVRKPLILNLQFAFLEKWDDEKLRKTARWLCQDFYKEMYFSDNPNIKYYTIANSTVDIIHNSLKQGYLNLSFRNVDSYAYSPIYSSSLYDLSTNPISTTLEFINNGDVPCKPLITVQVISGTSFSISNLSDGGNTISFTGLQANEILEINCENEDIKTSIPLTYRYDKMSGDFLSTIRGVNRLLCFGNIKLQFKYQFKLL